MLETQTDVKCPKPIPKFMFSEILDLCFLVLQSPPCHAKAVYFALSANAPWQLTNLLLTKQDMTLLTSCGLVVFDGL